MKFVAQCALLTLAALAVVGVGIIAIDVLFAFVQRAELWLGLR